MKKHYQILVIGGGTGGIMTAAQLMKKNKKLDIGLVEPADTHYYQPAWTLVGAGTYDYEKTARPMASLIPKGVDWVKDYATALKPEKNVVSTKSSGDISYDYLVLSPGLVNDTSLIEGLTEAIDKGVVCSNYTDPEHTWKVLQNFKGGNALFTQPSTPIKCGGAPQKIAYLAADYFRKKGILKDSNVIFATPGTVIFGVQQIKETLLKVIDRYGMHFRPYYAPFKIDAENQIAYFKYTAPADKRVPIQEGNKIGETIDEKDVISIPFDMLHLAPPQTAPKFVKDSVLVNEAGWVEVDHHSLQHVAFANVFSLGDVTALPTAKTGAAIRKQVPIVVDNLLSLIKQEAVKNHSYNGYSSCPLVTGYGKMVLAEFDYKNNFTPDPKLKQMLIFDSSKEHWRLWILKKYMLPYLYWNKMMKGKNV
ncbi:NAD(P)/FAD-dependent oxidoreductase [Muriicola marianensis]|uniref:Pyridine nucleotide-disulfide oxidoreductase n=1 Tax=Muriicola marianensis TaxID=1324801 RepID=A0ABQ1R7I9_9FLAO|nr:FAD/NAD(P)-binding oxidoreductase [Muriicola marianensis]GGD58417.1 pyridine nucleotide-disulfide oxidoreductase [Muriicola marianensis]